MNEVSMQVLMLILILFLVGFIFYKNSVMVVKAKIAEEKDGVLHLFLF